METVKTGTYAPLLGVPPLPSAAVGLHGKKRLTFPPTGRYAAACVTATRVRTTVATAASTRFREGGNTPR